MDDLTIKEGLKTIASKKNKVGLKKQNGGREDNEDWIECSSQIAFRVLQALRIKQMTQQELADLMGIDFTVVSKMLKGNVNFQLKTICKLENALGMRLIIVP